MAEDTDFKKTGLIIQEVWEARELNLRDGDFGNHESTASRTYIVRGTDNENIACYME